jgi:hypothetical protein
MEETAVLEQLYADLEVDREYLEVLLPYLELLLAIGIDFSNLHLQQTIEGHPLHLEAACQAVLAYAGELAAGGQTFTNRDQATSILIYALADAWQPTPDWQDLASIASAACYVSPYEQALRYIYALAQVQPQGPWHPQVIEALADDEIEALLPTLEQAWQAQMD